MQMSIFCEFYVRTSWLHYITKNTRYLTCRFSPSSFQRKIGSKVIPKGKQRNGVKLYQDTNINCQPPSRDEFPQSEKNVLCFCKKRVCQRNTSDVCRLSRFRSFILCTSSISVYYLIVLYVQLQHYTLNCRGATFPIFFYQSLANIIEAFP